MFVGSFGDVTVHTMRGTVLTFSNCQEGFILPVAVKRVLDTGTTATNLIGLLG